MTTRLDHLILLVNDRARTLAFYTEIVGLQYEGEHEIRNTGRALLRTLNFYVPPAYPSRGEELPAGRP